MKNRLFIIVAAILSLALASSCIKDDGYLYYNLTEFGVVKNSSSILSDEGVVLNIVGKECDANLDTMSRVMFLCDVLRPASETDPYEIILKQIVSVKVRSTVLFSSQEARDRQFDDPVYVSSCWFGGGYLNIGISYYVKTGSSTPHKLLLVQEPSTYDEDKGKQIDVNLHLYHEGGGESFANPDIEMSELRQVNTYLSIPVEQLDPLHGGKPESGMLMRLGRLWHTYELDLVDRETQMFYSYGTFNQ